MQQSEPGAPRWTDPTDPDMEAAPETSRDRKLGPDDLAPLAWDDDEDVTVARPSSVPPPRLEAPLDPDATHALRKRTHTDLAVTAPRDVSASDLAITDPRCPSAADLHVTRPHEATATALRRLPPPDSVPSLAALRAASAPPPPSSAPDTISRTTQLSEMHGDATVKSDMPFMPPSTQRSERGAPMFPPPLPPSPPSSDKRTRTQAVYDEIVIAAPISDAGEPGSFDPRSSQALPLVREVLEIEPATLDRPRPPMPPPAPRRSLPPASRRSSIPPAILHQAALDHDELLREVQRLRRSVRIASGLCAVALLACALLTTLLLSSGRLPALQANGGAIADEVLSEPVEPPQAAPAAAPPAAEPVKLLIDVRSPSTTVSLARDGQPAEMLAGPFPKTVELEPGAYTVFAARRGKTWSRSLTLKPGKPRELTVELR